MVAVHLATSDIGLEEGEYWKKLSLYYSVVYCYNGAQTYEQFLQVGWVYRALILLLCIRSSWCYIYILKIFCLYPSLYLWWAEPGGSGPWPSWLTIVLQCYDTVGWVIRPVKSSPKWPIMCLVGR